MVVEILAHVERAKARFQRLVDDIMRERVDPLRELREKSLEEMLREPGYVELRHVREWHPDEWL